MSTILSADDLNDFITPSVACIKPMESSTTQETAAIEIGPSGEALEQGRSLKPASISLTDCLACSGCITSSEAMLVELQSPKEMLKALAGSSKIFVASVCPQSRASMAAGYSMTIDDVDARLNGLFSRLGFRYVVGTQIGRAVSLEETVRELEHRQGSPVISSVCPGWTCYAEKTHPEILPYLSQVRSPQQITGQLLKSVVARQHGISEADVYHVSVMPCFDKKLEASRPDFTTPSHHAREVDLVITAKEVVDMLAQENQSFDQIPPVRQCLTPAGWPSDHNKISFGSSSGGYLAYVMHSVQGDEVQTVPGRNSDIVEYLVLRDGEVVFRGAQIYGFRNIQNLVRKLKAASRRRPGPSRGGGGGGINYDYVELMACPGGCVNGGGQLQPESQVSKKEWNAYVERKYGEIEMSQIDGKRVEAYLHNLECHRTDQLVRTSYHAVAADPALPTISIGTQW